MTLVSEHIDADTRERILVVAERLFRQLGSYEIKHDGYRFICHRDGDRVRVFWRG